MRSRVALALTAVVLTACSAAPATPPTTSLPTPDLAQLANQYGLVDCPATDPNATQVADGLPQTALTCLSSDMVVNLAGLPRTPTIVNLWAQWCGPCREEAPILREAISELDGVNLVGINYNDPKLDWAVEFAGRVGWKYPHVIDQDKTLQVPLKVPGLPTTYFVDADGRIAGVHAGQLESMDQLKALTAEYLGIK